MYTTAVNDLMLLFLFLMIGVVLRQIIKPLRKLYLPSGLIGGAAALIIGAAGLEPVCNARYLVKHGVTNDQYCTDYYIIRYRDQ